MKNNIRIRLANENDYASILKIYEPFITDTSITFEYEVPSIVDFSERLGNIQKTFPLLVCEVENIIAGYAYISRFREREAYDWSMESSIYINPVYQGKSIGKALYVALIGLSKLLGYCNIYGVVTMPNIKSEKLHNSFGFTTVGLTHNVGFKFGNWLDVKWYELNITDYSKQPSKPKTINEIAGTNEFNLVMDKAQNMVM
ncbi:MAG: N-acetyltransferase family protein [Sedimentibacter sp.]